MKKKGIINIIVEEFKEEKVKVIGKHIQKSAKEQNEKANKASVLEWKILKKYEINGGNIKQIIFLSLFNKEKIFIQEENNEKNKGKDF